MGRYNKSQVIISSWELIILDGANISGSLGAFPYKACHETVKVNLA